MFTNSGIQLLAKLVARLHDLLNISQSQQIIKSSDKVFQLSCNLSRVASSLHDFIQSCHWTATCASDCDKIMLVRLSLVVMLIWQFHPSFSPVLPLVFVTC